MVRRVAIWLSTLPRTIDCAVLVALTLLVWGLYPFARGLRFAGDDLNFLYVAWYQATGSLGGQLLAKFPRDAWTRALAFWPFVLATHLPAPIAFLQFFYAAVWLLNGVAIAYLTKALYPDSRLAPFVGGSLMVTATSDFHTNSVVYAPHMLGVALFFLGTAQLLRSAEPGAPPGRSLGAAVLLGASSFTIEYMYPAVPLLPLLVWVRVEPRWSARFWRAFAVVVVAFLPAATTLALHLARPGTYAASVLAPPCSLPPHCAPLEWLSLFARHVVHNLWPVGWAFRRIPPWYDSYEPIFGPPVCAAAATLGLVLATGWFLFVCRRSSERIAGPVASIAIIAFLAVLAVSAALVNPGGEYFVRSHFVSRGWTSLGLGVILSWLALATRWRVVALAIFAGFVFFGVWGGVERQSYLLGYAINERRELASLLDAVPGFEPSKRLIIIQPPVSPLLAANNSNTIPFLYGNAALRNSVIVAPNSPFEASTIGGDAAGRIVVTQPKRQIVIDPAISIMLFYSPSQQQFVRLDRSPAGLLRGSDSFFRTYRPKQNLSGQPSPRPRAVDEFLSHNEFASAGRRKDSFYRIAGIVAVSAAFSGRIQVDSLTPYALGRVAGADVAWLGEGPATGYSSLIWAREPVSSVLDVEISPAPGRSSAKRQLLVHLMQPDGTEQSLRQPFTHRGVLKWPLHFAAGANMLEVWLEHAVDEPPQEGAGEKDRLGYIERMILESQ